MGKLSGAARSIFNAKHPRGTDGKFVKAGSGGAPGSSGRALPGIKGAAAALKSLSPAVTRGRAGTTQRNNFAAAALKDDLATASGDDRARLGRMIGALDRQESKPAASKPDASPAAVSARLDAIQSREEAAQYLDSLKLSALEQQKLSLALGASLSGVSRKDQFRDRLIEHTVGYRLNSQTLRKGGWTDHNDTVAKTPGTTGWQPQALPTDALDSRTDAQLKKLAGQFSVPVGSRGEMLFRLRQAAAASPEIRKRISEPAQKRGGAASRLKGSLTAEQATTARANANAVAGLPLDGPTLWEMNRDSARSGDWRSEAPMSPPAKGSDRSLPDLDASWPGPAKLSPERQAQAEASLRRAVESRRPSGSEWTRFAPIRDAMAAEGFTRGEQDAAMHALAGQGNVRVIPVANLKSLSDDDFRAASKIGGELKHAIAIDASNATSGHAVPGEPTGPSAASRSAAIASLQRDLASVTPGSADHTRIKRMLDELRAEGAAARSRSADRVRASAGERFESAPPKKSARARLRNAGATPKA